MQASRQGSRHAVIHASSQPNRQTYIHIGRQAGSLYKSAGRESYRYGGTHMYMKAGRVV